MATNHTITRVIGQCAVDSGTLMIGDPCYFIDNAWTEQDYEENVCEKLSDKEHIRVPIHTNSPEVDKATIIHTYWGDGVYPVTAKIERKTGKILSITIKLK